jgi:hypothetical protein
MRLQAKNVFNGNKIIGFQKTALTRIKILIDNETMEQLN